MVQAALAILGEIAYNADVVKLLERAAGDLIPFVGAGLSVDFGYPGWGDLLRSMADRAGMRPEVEALLLRYAYEEAAELLLRDAPNAFDDCFGLTFDHSLLPSPLGKGAVRLLPRIARGPVITTNFDRVLEAAFAEACRPFPEVLIGGHVHAESRAIQLFRPSLLKLHGDYADPESRVLTRNDYARVYGSDDPERVDLDLPLPRILSQALSARPLLFLGCSLVSDRTTRVIGRIARLYPGTVHFALLSDKDNTPERRRLLYSWNIRPLFFRGGFEKIGAFLACLAGDPPARKSPPAAPPGPRDEIARLLDDLGNDLKGLDREARRFAARGRWKEVVAIRRRQADVALQCSDSDYAAALEALGDAYLDAGDPAAGECAWAEAERVLARLRDSAAMLDGFRSRVAAARLRSQKTTPDR